MEKFLPPPALTGMLPSGEAGSLGVTITGVISAGEGSYTSPQPVINAQSAFSTVSGVATPIVPGTMAAPASVQMTYGIG